MIVMWCSLKNTIPPLLLSMIEIFSIKNWGGLEKWRSGQENLLLLQNPSLVPSTYTAALNCL